MARTRSTSDPALFDMPSSHRPATIDVLERRLADGYARIELALANGEEVSSWEDFWIDLLRRYEAECDAMLAAA